MKEIKKKLKEAGYKLTRPRMAVLSVLKKSERPVTAKYIFGQVEKIDLVSVYRTLALLEELSLVNCEVLNGEKIYCLALHPHHHIVCRKCGKIESFECRHHFEDFKGFSDVKHQMLVSGICNNCNQ